MRFPPGWEGIPLIRRGNEEADAERPRQCVTPLSGATSVGGERRDEEGKEGAARCARET